MAEYKISGVWKDTNNIITHYAVHTVGPNGTPRADKMTKAQSIALVDDSRNTVYTWIWNYTSAFWKKGETVRVINGASGKYLRSDPDNTLTDNLAHLIDFDWLS